MKTKFILISIFSYFAIWATSKGQNNVVVTGTQTNDSLSLNAIIREIMDKHPTVKGAEEALNMADAKIGLAKSGYYPTVDMTANYYNMGPVVKISIPDMGSFKLFPENNYSAAITAREIVYDFGRTRDNIELENRSKVLGEQAVEQIKQRIAIAGIGCFYTISFLQEAIVIKKEQLEALNVHLKYVETMKSTGSATDFQILSTKVRISAIQSQLVDLQTALSAQQAYLNSLLGTDPASKPVVMKELKVLDPVLSYDSLLAYAYRNRDEMLMNKQKISIAQIRYELTKAYKRPMISAYASGGAKNGYIPDLNQIRPNYQVGVGLAVSIFDAYRTKYNLKQTESAINTLGFETESTKRSITAEVSDAMQSVRSTLQKIDQYELQLEEANQAYSLAQINFEAGSITNLDLLDTNTTLSESRLLLLKARIDHVSSIYRLKAALGERLY